MTHGDAGQATRNGLDPQTAKTIAEAMQALAAPSRVQILGRLRHGPCAVGELAAAAGMEQSAVSHQLRMLRHLGVVVTERRGRQIIYSLHDAHVAALLDEAISHAEHRQLQLRG
jgi:DNA-binding transcriptional ArsR family regulator